MFARALDEAQLFPLIDASFAEAADAVRTMQPAAVLVAAARLPQADLAVLAGKIRARKPYVPLLALDPLAPPPANALPLWRSETNSERLVARLRGALRVRALHATVLRRLAADATQNILPETDPACDATALLIGRGGNYPALSVALGERMGCLLYTSPSPRD